MSDFTERVVVYERRDGVACDLEDENPWVCLQVSFPSRRSKRLQARDVVLNGLLTVPLHGFGHGGRKAK